MLFMFNKNGGLSSVVCSTDLVSVICLLFCALLLAVVRSAGQVTRVAPCGSAVAPLWLHMASLGADKSSGTILFILYSIILGFLGISIQGKDVE